MLRWYCLLVAKNDNFGGSLGWCADEKRGKLRYLSKLQNSVNRRVFKANGAPEVLERVCSASANQLMVTCGTKITGYGNILCDYALLEENKYCAV